MPERVMIKKPGTKADERVLKGSGAALAEFYKALKALSFYPESHPLRGEILQRSYQAVKGLMLGTGLSLVVRRNGLSFADREEGIESTRMTMALAKELFAREIQRLTLLSELSLADFTEFLSLLVQEPQRIIADGGVEKILTRMNITTILANEINIAAVFTKRSTPETSETASGEGTSAGEESGGGQGAGPGEGHGENEAGAAFGGIPFKELGNLSVKELLALMEKENDDSRYIQMARLLASKGYVLKEDGDFDTLFPILIGLLNQNADESRSALRRETSMEAFQELAGGAMLAHLLDRLEEESYNQKEIVYLVLHHMGNEAVEAVIPRLAVSDCQAARKALTTAMLRIGPSAIPRLLTFLKDDDWQVARNAAAVLGEMGSRSAVKGLVMTAYHMDTRVRFEAIRSLAAIGGKEATDTLLDLLGDGNRAVRRQAILWLGLTRNQGALQPLLDLVMKRDFTGKLATLKKETLLAVERIGDPAALDDLFRLVEKTIIFAPRRWQELKILALGTIGRLGGERAREFLQKTALRSGPIGRASSAVLETMEDEVNTRHE